MSLKFDGIASRLPRICRSRSPAPAIQSPMKLIEHTREYLVGYALIAGSLVLTAIAAVQFGHREPLQVSGLREGAFTDSLEATSIHLSESGTAVVAISDYLCPSCSVLARNLRSLDAKHPGRLSVSVHHFIVSGDSMSVTAAVAVECAARVGVSSSVDLRLYSAVDRGPLTDSIVRELLVGSTPTSEQAEVASCFDTRAPKDRVESDSRRARELGLLGTPALVVRGRLYYGALSTDSLESLLLAPEGKP